MIPVVVKVSFGELYGSGMVEVLCRKQFYVTTVLLALKKKKPGNEKALLRQVK